MSKDHLELIESVEAKKAKHMKNGRLDMAIACDKILAVLQDDMDAAIDTKTRHLKGRKTDD
jgi:hypothetical protein